MKPKEIGIEHEALGEFRWQFDEALQAVTRTMIRRGMQCGTVSAKVDIVIREITKDDGEVIKMMVIEPDISLKVGSKEKFKCQKVGAMYVKTAEDGTVIAGDNQISMDEYLNDQKGA